MSTLPARPPSSHKGLCDLLVAYLRGEPDARERFPGEAAEILTALAARHAWFLPVDVREEVVNEAHLILLERLAGFDPQRAPAPVYLRLVVRDAVKRVASSYCPPGWKTRATNAEIEKQRGAVLSLEAKIEDGFEYRDHRAELDIYQRCDLRTVFDRAPRTLGVALERIYYHGESTKDVAASMGLTRFTLARQIKAFADTFQGASRHRAIAA